MSGFSGAISAPDQIYYKKARAQQAELTKPLGSLGRLEDIAVRLAAMQKTDHPEIDSVWISVFAADHGIAEAGVSAFPQSVTMEMVRNFAAGGAAINVLARQINAHLEIVDTGMAQELALDNVINDRSGNGTKNFLQSQAMTDEQLDTSLNAGKKAVKRALIKKARLFIGGEMGIGNTTSAAAIACALSHFSPIDIAGAGTGLDQKGIDRKIEVIQSAMEKHQTAAQSPLAVLQCLGGFEIAALTGAYLVAAEHGLPVLVDGFIATVAAFVAVKINAQAQEWFFYAHRSAETGHRLILEEMAVKPLLDLEMRLGEGSGAATAVNLLQSACALHNGMATFSQAEVSKKTG